MNGEELIEALKVPAAYDHPVREVATRETHISWVLLTGEFAYKIKKPVDLGFADFSTLERRRRYCEEEVRLNGRLAPDLYLGVVPITVVDGTPRIGGAGDPVEYAVRMRQFPQDSLLPLVLLRRELRPDHLDGLAQRIARFHASVPPAAAQAPWGSAAVIESTLEETMRDLGRGTRWQDLADDLRKRMRAELDRLRETFETRKADGFVRECHGDLHLGNMYLRDDRVEVFDCIEFNDRFRWIDVQSEIAFAVMDLADRGRADYSRRFLNAYLERTGDYDGLRVLRFYLIYRAAVRAKVACLRLAQAEVAVPERRDLDREVGEYLQLAHRYAKPSQPSIVITHGLSGSGKSTVAQSILESLGAVRIRSDVERKRLFGQDASARYGGGLEQGIYAKDATEKTYARLAELAADIVAAGFPAIVDATFLKRRDRESFRELARRLNVPFAILDVQADEATLRRRISDRLRARTDPSDANLRVLDSQLATREPLGEDELVLTVDVVSGSQDSVERAFARLEELGVGGGERLVAPETASGRGSLPQS